jgi:outer membrane protein OmpA-like peptidoglycan-associated protein
MSFIRSASFDEEKGVQTPVIKSKVNWLPMVLWTIIILGLILFVIKGCNGADISQTDAMDNSARTDNTIVAEVMPTRESLKVKLPNSIELDAYKGGIEDQLVRFLNDPAGIPGKDVWFDFDNLNFKIGSAEITEESMAQVQNIAAILKAYPKVKIKIGGYTDKTGDSLGNLKLSQERANAVTNALLAAKSNVSQLVGAEGYGSRYAKVPKDASDDERKKDRRIAVGVRAK